MPWKSSLLILGLAIGLSGAGFSAADAAAVTKQQALHAQQAKAAQAAKARKAAAAKQQKMNKQQKMKKREWYENDRDRGLDIASEYAPDTIARVRKKNYIAKGDTVKTGSRKRGWQHYMDKYYKR